MKIAKISQTTKANNQPFKSNQGNTPIQQSQQGDTVSFGMALRKPSATVLEAITDLLAKLAPEDRKFVYNTIAEVQGATKDNHAYDVLLDVDYNHAPSFSIKVVNNVDDRSMGLYPIKTSEGFATGLQTGLREAGNSSNELKIGDEIAADKPEGIKMLKAFFSTMRIAPDDNVLGQLHDAIKPGEHHAVYEALAQASNRVKDNPYYRLELFHGYDSNVTPSIDNFDGFRILDKQPHEPGQVQRMIGVGGFAKSFIRTLQDTSYSIENLTKERTEQRKLDETKALVGEELNKAFG